MRRFGLMIFAAGFGTRMGDLTRRQPKPLIPVAGRPLIDRALALGTQAGCWPIVVNLHYLAPMLARHLAGRDVILSHEAETILETGGGLKAALRHFAPGAALMTLNPDAVWLGPNPLSTLAQAWRDPMAALLLVGPSQGLAGRAPGPADFHLAPDGRLTRARGAAAGVTYLGAQIIAPGPVGAWPDRAFSLNPVWDRLIAEGRLYGLTYPGTWCDVGHPEGLAQAEALLQGGESDG